MSRVGVQLEELCGEQAVRQHVSERESERQGGSDEPERPCLRLVQASLRTQMPSQRGGPRDACYAGPRARSRDPWWARRLTFR